MRALILAGGFATRLRPLSCSKPKLLFPIVGVPLVESMARWLGSAGVNHIVLAVNHLSDTLKTSIGDRIGGVKVSFSCEETPLGTAGPIKLAAKILTGNEPFFVLNGDVVADVDLRRMVAIHNEKKPEATIALVSTPDPAPYGSVVIDSSGEVRRFTEKSNSPSGSPLVNAGVYLFSPSLIEAIPSGRPASLERDIFPLLAERHKMQTLPHKGYWYDIGRIPEYVRTNRELLAIQSRDSKKRSEVVGGGRLVSPSFIGANSLAGSDTVIGPYAILGDNTTIGSKSVVSDSIIFEETQIGEGTVVEGSILGERVTVGKNSRIGRGSVIAGQLTIPAGTNIGPNSTILF